MSVRSVILGSVINTNTNLLVLKDLPIVRNELMMILIDTDALINVLIFRPASTKTVPVRIPIIKYFHSFKGVQAVPFVKNTRRLSRIFALK